jgi:hypothetical protein
MHMGTTNPFKNQKSYLWAWKNIQVGMHIHYGRYNFHKKYVIFWTTRKRQNSAKNKSFSPKLGKIYSFLQIITLRATGLCNKHFESMICATKPPRVTCLCNFFTIKIMSHLHSASIHTLYAYIYTTTCVKQWRT